MIIYSALKAKDCYAVRWSRVLRPLLLVNVTEGRQVTAHLAHLSHLSEPTVGSRALIHVVMEMNFLKGYFHSFVISRSDYREVS